MLWPEPWLLLLLPQTQRAYHWVPEEPGSPWCWFRGQTFYWWAGCSGSEQNNAMVRMIGTVTPLNNTSNHLSYHCLTPDPSLWAKRNWQFLSKQLTFAKLFMACAFLTLAEDLWAYVKVWCLIQTQSLVTLNHLLRITVASFTEFIPTNPELDLKVIINYYSPVCVSASHSLLHVHVCYIAFYMYIFKTPLADMFYVKL